MQGSRYCFIALITSNKNEIRIQLLNFDRVINFDEPEMFFFSQTNFMGYRKNTMNHQFGVESSVEINQFFLKKRDFSFSVKGF